MCKQTFSNLARAIKVGYLISSPSRVFKTNARLMVVPKNDTSLNGNYSALSLVFADRLGNPKGTL